jgi:hypothetical protein
MPLKDGGLMPLSDGWDWLMPPDVLSANATELTSAVALEKRAAGSLARLRIITPASAGRMWGLTSTGEVGVL